MSVVDPSVRVQAMAPADWEEVRGIYRDGIASGLCTFEVDAPSWQQWDVGHHPFGRLVARSGARVLGWAALSPVSGRCCYAGVAEVSVYVGAAERGRGLGRLLLQAIIAESERHGIWTLQGATFPENAASLRLQRSCGFREIGRRERIAQLHGVWRDTILTERRSPVVGRETATLPIDRRDNGMQVDVILKRFESPDETRIMTKGRFEILRLGGVIVGRATYEPGWRWSEHVGPAVGAARCCVEHVGMVLSGAATAAFADGRVVELRAGEMFYIPPVPHDSWVLGTEPYVSLHFLGAEKYAR